MPTRQPTHPCCCARACVCGRSYVDEAIGENPKNYQVWYHRRFLVNALDDGTAELPFTKAILTMDSKNYHAWSHRQWVLKRFGLWTDELDFVERALRCARGTACRAQAWGACA